MRWIVKIEGKEDQRILVKFDPMKEEVVFIGQFKPRNREWVDFCEERYTMEIDLEAIQNQLSKVVKIMRERLAAYNNLAEGFTILKLIAVEEE